eukprot:gene8896-18414_t
MKQSSRVVKKFVPNIITGNKLIEVWIPKNGNEVEEWAHHENILSNKNTILGFDIEWRPSYTKNIYNKVGLIQLAGEHSVALVQMAHFKEIPKILSAIIGSKDIIKTGVGVYEDLHRLQHDFSLSFGAFWDCHPTGSSLAKLAEHFLQVQMPKPWSIRLSDWNSTELSAAQMKYAAHDAVIG